MRPSLSRQATQEFGIMNEAPAPEWSNTWRPAPEHLVGEWRSMSTPAKAALMRARHELTNGDEKAYFCSCSLMDAGAVMLSDVLLNHSMQLQLVNLQNNCISDRGAVQLAEALELGGGPLQVINLSNNRICDEGANRFSDLLAEHVDIKLMNMDSNKVSDVGANSLVAALTKNPRTDVACILTNNPVHRFNAESLANLAAPAYTINVLAKQGVTLGQLLNLYAEGVANGTIVPGETTTGDVVQTFVLPTCHGKRCNWVQAVARNGKQNPPPGAHVIHAWDGLFVDLVRCVANHACGRQPGKRDPNMTLDPDSLHWKYSPEWTGKSFFIDAFCVNQRSHVNARAHGAFARFVEKPAWRAGEPCCQIDKLHLVANKIRLQGGRLVLVVDSRNTVLTRIQCLYEVYCAISGGMPVDVIFTALNKFPRNKRDTMVQDSEASSDYMRLMILDEIEKYRVGGFDAFNQAVLDFMDHHSEVEFRAVVG